MTALRIDRSIWLRGEGSEDSRLLREGDGKQCCNGILLEALGVPRELLADRTSAYSLATSRYLSIAHVVGLVYFDDAGILHDSDWARTLYSINDNPDICEAVRERKLTKAFKEGGVEVTFTS